MEPLPNGEQKIKSSCTDSVNINANWDATQTIFCIQNCLVETSLALRHCYVDFFASCLGLYVAIYGDLCPIVLRLIRSSTSTKPCVVRLGLQSRRWLPNSNSA